MTSPTTIRATDFIGALGVNIHFGQYGYGPAKIISELSYLGIDQVRQHAIGPRTSVGQIGSFDDLANAGVKFDWLTGGPLDPTLQDLDTFLSAHPDSIATIEGPNEVNNFPIAYGGLTGTDAAMAYQQALFSAVTADPLAGSIPVLDFTNLVLPATAAASAANIHLYPSGGQEPGSKLAAAEAQLQKLMPQDAVYITEVGYSSSPAAGGVDPATQAKLTLNLLMDAEKAGVSAIYLYDLTDDGNDPGGTLRIDHYGLFTYAGQAKPVAVAIHNLTSILADGGANASGFTPRDLNYSLSGMPALGDSLVVEKSSGVYDVVVWAEPQIWDGPTGKPVAAPTESVTVSFDSDFGQISVYDPLTSTNPISSTSNADSVTVQLTDHPIIIQVSNLAQAMAGMASTAARSEAAIVRSLASTSHSLVSAPHG